MGLLDRAVDKLKTEQTEAPVVAGRPAAREAASDAATEAQEAVGEPMLADDGGTFSTGLQGGPVDIGLSRLAARGFIVPGYPTDSMLLNEYRRIKRQLLFKVAVDQAEVEQPLHSNLILFTSAIDGEGKTFVSTNLAFSISQEVDRSALLIDADVIRRGASRLFGLEQHLGLIDYLKGDVDDITSLFVQPKGLDNLNILPAGTPSEDVNELLASERMRELIEELALQDPERIVLCDASPILMTSEAHILAQLVGQVVLVVRADQTPQHHVENALGYMQPDRFAGLVLNGASRSLAQDGYADYDYGTQ